ncbi:MAG: hypothetical protein U0354_11195 [Candidatus Sericytochromatia bacterium]
MGIELVKNQNLAQYASLLANPQFLNAIKSATKNDKTGKYSSLLENLEKLSSSLEESNSDTKTTETDSGESLSLLKSVMPQSSVGSTNKSGQQSLAMDDSIREAINQLIANAEMMEDMLDLEVTPSGDEFTNLLAKFREIITKLDQETRKIHDEVKEKKTKEEFKLTPSSNSKSGFNESITLLAK